VIAPFLVHGTGCTPLELVIRLTDVSTGPAELRRTIPFHCAE